MGHGNEIFSTGAYVELEGQLNERYPGVPSYVGNVEGYPELSHVVKKLREKKVENVTLLPFMVVAGDHALNDMAGEDKESWKSQLIKEKFQVTATLRGLGEMPELTEIFIDHLKDAMRVGEGFTLSGQKVSKDKK
jgi:sirohydrochlorin cobaltochelatase